MYEVNLNFKNSLAHWTEVQYFKMSISYIRTVIHSERCCKILESDPGLPYIPELKLLIQTRQCQITGTPVPTSQSHW